MFISPAFTFEAASAALIGGLGIGVIAAIYTWFNKDTMPSATLNASVHTGMLTTSSVLSGMLFGVALVAPHFYESAFMAQASLARMVISGALVGAGSQFGCGCTSGNGIQGLACRSLASLVFVATFMGCGAVSAALFDQSASLIPTATTLSWGLAGAAAALAAAQLACARGSMAKNSVADEMRRRDPAPNPERVMAESVASSLRAASNVLCGAGFAVSLTQASMVKPSKVLGFLHFAGPLGWDPSLAFVMGGALAVAVPAWWAFGLVEKGCPALKKFASRAVDARTVAGGVLFGSGWGYGGLCPGPAVVMAGTGSFAAAAWLLSMFATHAAATLLAVREKKALV
jgi:uncharacterized membrane protein YedE/YeeE